MYRPLIPAVAVFSLVLFLATLALWLRSYWRADEVYRLETGRGDYLEAARGSVMYFSSKTYAYPRSRPEWFYVAHADPAERRQVMHDIEQRSAARPGNGFSLLGIRFRGGAWLAGKDATVVMIPLWAPLAILAIPSALWLRRHHRLVPGLCPHCRYDLRATPGRCPECGHVVAQPSSPAA
jgi:hypothetical protein